jgi:hypothetical protein
MPPKEIKIEISPTEVLAVKETQLRGARTIEARIHCEALDGCYFATKRGFTLDPDLAVELARALLELAEPEHYRDRKEPVPSWNC